MSLETTERRSCNILPKEKVTNFPGRYFRWVLYTSIHIVAKVQLHLQDWSYDIFYQILWSTKSEAPLVGRNPSYRLPFHIAFTGPPKKMVKKNTRSFQTKKNSNPRLEGRLASDLSWFFGLYYLSNRNFAEISTQHHTWAGRRALTKTPKKTFQPKKAISTGSATRVWAKRNRILSSRRNLTSPGLPPWN